MTRLVSHEYRQGPGRHHEQRHDHRRAPAEAGSHCSPATEACRSRPMDGSATLTIVLSKPTMNRLEEQMTSTSRRRRRLSSDSGITRIDWSERNCVSTTNYLGRARDARPHG